MLISFQGYAILFEILIGILDTLGPGPWTPFQGFNIIILGDMNEDLLKYVLKRVNPKMHNFKDVLLNKVIISLQNILSHPTRQLALLDPIILHEDM